MRCCLSEVCKLVMLCCYKCGFFIYLLLNTIHYLQVKIMERAEVKEKKLVINIVELSEVGFIETEIVSSCEAVVSLVHFVPVDGSVLMEL